MPAFLKQHGYQTACIGKWHLGLGWPRRPGTEPFQDDIEKGEDGWGVEFLKPIEGGPNSAGFDKGGDEVCDKEERTLHGDFSDSKVLDLLEERADFT